MSRLFKPICGEDNVHINLIGEIKGENYKINGSYVTLEIFNVPVSVDIKWLALVAHYEISNVTNVEDLFKFEFVRTDVESLRLVSNHICYLRSPIYLTDTHRLVPGYTNLAIAENGDVINLSDAYPFYHKMKGDKNCYTTDVTYIADRSKIGVVARHRLVALAWVKNNDWSTRHYVNHLNGDKSDYFSSNLEWCTCKENNDHAVETGLSSKAKALKIKNAFTDEVFNFPSITKLCQYFNVPVRNTSLFISRNPRSLFKGEWEVKYDKDESMWYYSEENRPVMPRARNIWQVVSEDGTETTVVGVNEFVRYFKLWNLSTTAEELTKVAKKRFPNVTVELLKFGNTGPFVAKDIETEKIYIGKTFSQIDKLANKPKGTARMAFVGGKGKVINGLMCRSPSKDPWPDPVANESKPVKVLAVNKKAGVRELFCSIRSAAEHCNVNRKRLTKALDSGMEYRGWYFSTKK